VPLLFYIEGEATYISMSSWPKQYVESLDSLNMLHLVFANFTDLNSLLSDPGLVTPDSHLPHLSIDVLLPHVRNNFNCEFSCQIVAAGSYTFLKSFYLRVIVQACMKCFYR
jgi:hypothetical protein